MGILQRFQINAFRVIDLIDQLGAQGVSAFVTSNSDGDPAGVGVRIDPDGKIWFDITEVTPQPSVEVQTWLASGNPATYSAKFTVVSGIATPNIARGPSGTAASLNNWYSLDEYLEASLEVVVPGSGTETEICTVRLSIARTSDTSIIISDADYYMEASAEFSE